jgi:hypothetical protein
MIMQEITIYEAEDGKRFDDIEECLNHELEVLLENGLNKDLSLFNYKNEKMIIDKNINYQDVYGFNAKTLKALDFLYEQFTRYGIITDTRESNLEFLEKGSFIWNADNYEWDNVEEVIAEKEAEIEQLKKILEN